MSKKYTQYKRFIGDMCRNFDKHDGAVMVELAFIYKIPTSWSKKKKANANNEIPIGDVDNNVKSVLDALEGIAYTNDRQVVAISASKAYGDDDLVYIKIEGV